VNVLDIKGEYRVARYILKGKYYPDMSYQETAEAYNGVGPAWFTPWIRKLLNVLLKVFRDAVIIHDCDYTKGFTLIDKRIADLRFFKNCLLCVVFKLYLRPVKAIRFTIYSFLLYLAVKRGGAKAFWKGKEKIT